MTTTTDTGPPQPREPDPTSKNPMGPPPPPHLNFPTETTSEEAQAKAQAQSSNRSSVPYTKPEWSGPPCHQYYLEVLKEGSIINQIPVCEKEAYLFGRVDICDVVLQHPTVSRFHAVLQFKRNGDSYLYDTGSTHGTFVNKKQVEKRVHVDLHVGDVIRFGQSSRMYIFQGPEDLMPPEKDHKLLRKARIQQEMLDQEASLRRARAEASLADGVSWGMGEDAIEETEDDSDEITWQTYKGQLTEKQEKTREKVLKRTEKISHMKKEIDAIRAKDIAQGGLTQGQQTQIARNELRINQIMEELENLEETLNESIRESIGAHIGVVSRGKGRSAVEDGEEYLSDDDEFYDRTEKALRSKVGQKQTTETADTLLDKRDSLMKEIEEIRGLLLMEKNKLASKSAVEAESNDSLDDFMSGVSSQLVLDKTTKLEKELSALQSEVDRIIFLLKIADPSGEAAKKRDLKDQVKPDFTKTQDASKKHPSHEPKKTTQFKKLTDIYKQEEIATEAKLEDNQQFEKIATDAKEVKSATYTVAKPQWLGAVDDRTVQQKEQEEISNANEPDQFVDYKDRQKMLSNIDGAQIKVDSDIESAAPGLIMRKRKENERPPSIDDKAPEQFRPSSDGANLMAEDAVALLLKHKRGYHADDEEESFDNQETEGMSQPKTNNKKPKKVLGPEKPSFLGRSDYEWLPPEGQSGDGRTTLNERYGY